MFAYIKSLFLGQAKQLQPTSDDGKEKERIKYEAAFSYIFKKKRIVFDDLFCFTIRYLYHDRDIWIMAQDFARGVGLVDPDNIGHIIDRKYMKTINEIIFFNNVNLVSHELNIDSDDDVCFCINKHGILQVLENVEFVNKPEFTSWLLESVLFELESQYLPISPIDNKLTKVLDALESIKSTGFDLETLRQDINEKFDALEKRMSIEVLHDKLREYHNQTNYGPDNGRDVYDDCRFSLLSDIRSRNGGGNNTVVDCSNERRLCRYESVRFPRDSSKHPRLAVYVKSLDDNSTEIAFLSGQSRRHRAMKRKFSDMELVYDNVHPNPQLAIMCLNEELDMKNLKYKKKNSRMLHVDCSLSTARSFISENL